MTETAFTAEGVASVDPGPCAESPIQAQLLRYAEDLQTLLNEHANLANSNNELLDSLNRLDQERLTLELLIQSSRDAHLTTELDGVIIEANAAAASLFKVPVLRGCLLDDLMPAEARVSFAALRIQAGLGKEISHPSNFTLADESGEKHVLLTRAVLAPRQSDGRPILHWLMRDETHGRGVDIESNLSVMAFQNTSEGIMITDAEGVILSVNPAFSRITGYSLQEVVGRSPALLQSGLHSPQFYQAFWHDLLEEGFWQGEIINRRKNGENYAEWLTVTSVCRSGDCIARFVAVFSDVTPLHNNEKRLNFIAYHDSLTGLANRARFLEQLVHSISQARRSEQALTLLFIDLDGFKGINDGLGHKLGDLVLRQVAARLSRAVRESDFVARLGGDEFVVIMPGMRGEISRGLVAGKLIEALRQPMLLEGHRLNIGASIGSATFPDDADNDAMLLRHADKAMYQAKRSGGNMHVMYRQGKAQGPAVIGDTLCARINGALVSEHFELHFQPYFDLTLDPPRLSGVEALLRWRQADQHDWPPASLFGDAEHCETVNQIGAWVLNTACAQVKAWQREVFPGLRLTVNIASRYLSDPGFVGNVLGALSESGLEADSLELDIHERDAMSDIEGDQSRLSLLRSMGVQLAIGDLGSGDCNLRRLHTLPLTRLKMGVELISELHEQSDLLALCKAFIEIGAAFRFEVAAIGVETAAQLDALRQIGCRIAQGYLLGRPMPANVFLAWARRHSTALSGPAGG